ncbi:hypothetical protein [Lentibacillus amyloliquefaciens]|uniref:Uncharacterized protein n=1 Tax=Lentibacillus amyloliquefaciens TaxID=1472767 RepID=A0A0U4E4F2_9BACI|nr:hypothetical protein [Lentibacillus amyloliquefaciens]ALX47777.1 hypothetical protein AOX59_03635 [Lentibacillus amyloliquefaciens]
MESSIFDIELETVTMVVNIEEVEDQGNEVVNFFIVEDLDGIKINLSDSDVNDIKSFYDEVFEYIISEQKLVEFQLVYEKNNLFFEVASDIIEHLNDEIKQSKDNFKKIIRLTNDKKDLITGFDTSKMVSQ